MWYTALGHGVGMCSRVCAPLLIINFIQNTHHSHPIVCPWGQHMCSVLFAVWAFCYNHHHRHVLCNNICIRPCYSITYSGLILGLRPANERCSYFVTTSLIGWAQTLNQPWYCDSSKYHQQTSVISRIINNFFLWALLSTNDNLNIWCIFCGQKFN